MKLVIYTKIRRKDNNGRNDKKQQDQMSVIEMSTNLDNFGIDKETKVINKIYVSSNELEVLSRSIFITLPKKPGCK